MHGDNTLKQGNQKQFHKPTVSTNHTITAEVEIYGLQSQWWDDAKALAKLMLMTVN